MAPTQKLVEKFDARIGFCGRLILWLFPLFLLTWFLVVGAAILFAVVGVKDLCGLVFVDRFRASHDFLAVVRGRISFCLGVGGFH